MVGHPVFLRMSVVPTYSQLPETGTISRGVSLALAPEPGSSFAHGYPQVSSPGLALPYLGHPEFPKGLLFFPPESGKAVIRRLSE